MSYKIESPPQISDERRWLTVKEFRQLYGLGHTYTYNLLREGKLARVKVGRATRILSSSVQIWAAGIEAGGES